MDFMEVSRRDGIAEVALRRGKVNAIHEPMIRELRQCLEQLAGDAEAKAVTLTSRGPFFSFGFDIPELLKLQKPAFLGFTRSFAELYTYLFAYPKPLVAALNGHAIAGGCMLALACDRRLMVSGKARISLNEITFGSSLFAGSVRMLSFVVGERSAQTIACEGAMYSAEEAQRLGLVDEVCAPEALAADAEKAARRLAERDPAAYRSIKGLLRGPIAKEMAAAEPRSLFEFAEIWYSPSTWKNLQAITIRS
jgi:3,2-trans-enoyl-CoA isomerase